MTLDPQEYTPDMVAEAFKKAMHGDSVYGKDGTIWGDERIRNANLKEEKHQQRELEYLMNTPVRPDVERPEDRPVLEERSAAQAPEWVRHGVEDMGIGAGTAKVYQTPEGWLINDPKTGVNRFFPDPGHSDQ